MRNDLSTPQLDQDIQETQEWLESLAALLMEQGTDRAQYLLERLNNYALNQGINVPLNTPYRNTIPANKEPQYPGDEAIEERILSMIRWNAAMMVLRAGKKAPELGGHISTYASAANLYEVGFQHCFHGKNDQHGGDLLFIQGHSSPGIYARAFLEGRITEQQMDAFRQEISHKDGLSSYPHPWLMPDFWQFPTVSMGLGPLQAIYQARFLKYLHNRGLADTSQRKVWAFLGDGECDEVESLGALSFAAREGLDNLIFVINCNLQRLDGPVYGNGKIIQKLEALFRGAGWRALKVIWGAGWDELYAKDKTGHLQLLMNETVDGDFLNYRANDGTFIREKFFAKYSETLELVKHLSDDDIFNLRRGGHDSRKVYAAYAEAMAAKGQPTVILAKTVKGYGMGAHAGESLYITHQQKKMNFDSLKHFRDRFNIPITDDKLADYSFYRPADKSPEVEYLQEQRAKLGGYLPARRFHPVSLPAPELSAFDAVLKGSGEREISTTMAFVRILSILLKDKTLGARVVPIVPDESRTFGMEGLFKQIGIYSPVGQRYRPSDADQIMSYHETDKGQLLEEGINEAGAMASWMAAASSYANNDLPMIPFYIYYSMFGFQRVGDLAWASGDMQTRGFLLGGTAGRTTLAGEGLQHQDGHNPLIAATIPNCVTYDPCYAYELAVIIRDGLKRMVTDQENIFYYLTVMNENYMHPAMPEGSESGILKGMYLLKAGKKNAQLRVKLLGGGTILREVEKAAQELEEKFEVAADVFSATSFNELRKEGLAVEHYNRFHPTEKPRQSYVTELLNPYKGPTIAATDYMKAYADQIRAFIPGQYVVLGTDGFGRSDTRKALRDFFEVDYRYIVVAALKALADEDAFPAKKVQAAMKDYGLDSEKPNPVEV